MEKTGKVKSERVVKKGGESRVRLDEWMIYERKM